MYFTKRIPEPQQMGSLEFDVFENESKKSYKRWMLPLVDDAMEVVKIKSGKILDVACGPGLLAKEFALRYNEFQIFGIASSSVALKMTQRNCYGLNNIIFQKVRVQLNIFSIENILI